MVVDIIKFDKPKQFPKDEILNENERLVRAYASIEQKDMEGDVIPISEFKRVLNTWMNRGAPIQDLHSNRPVGKGLNWAIEQDPKSGKEALRVDYKIYNDYSVDDEVWEQIKSGQRTGLSIGAREKQAPQIEKDESGGGFQRKVGPIELYEISSVDKPCNEGAVNLAVNYLAKGGVDHSEEERKLAADLQKGYEGDIMKPFAGFGGFDACVLAQKERGHSQESAQRVCGWLKHRTEKSFMEGTLMNKKGCETKKEEECNEEGVDYRKALIPLSPGKEPPKGAKVITGPKGGKYYESTAPGEGEEVPQETGQMPDFSAWGFDANSGMEQTDHDGNEGVGVGSKVQIHSELTHDPGNHKGDSGIVVGMNDNGDLLVEFDDGAQYAAYTADSVIDQTAAGVPPDAGDVDTTPKDEKEPGQSEEPGKTLEMMDQLYDGRDWENIESFKEEAVNLGFHPKDVDAYIEDIESLEGPDDDQQPQNDKQQRQIQSMGQFDRFNYREAIDDGLSHDEAIAVAATDRALSEADKGNSGRQIVDRLVELFQIDPGDATDIVNELGVGDASTESEPDVDAERDER